MSHRHFQEGIRTSADRCRSAASCTALASEEESPSSDPTFPIIEGGRCHAESWLKPEKDGVDWTVFVSVQVRSMVSPRTVRCGNPSKAA
mmetsp:Transcript_66673/g.156979  ORF Transcript_66673/g.156979 Transcript_66673/m.156979 type:complete len:89 (-) Transcript_66673:23-289(-)